MQVQFELTVGKNKFTLIENVDSHADFFKKMSFYSTLPKVGPNGEEDLIIQHRVAQKQYDYYSIVCPSAKMEFKFGQVKEGKGNLFAKGWEPLYQADSSEDGAEQGAAPSGGLGTQAPQTGASVGLGAPAAQAPKASPTVGLGSLGSLKPAAAPTPAPAPAASTPAPAASPAVQQKASNVLAKFGI